MSGWLLIFAGVNLALAAVGLLLPLAHHGQASRRLVRVGVPALWALLLVGVYLYLRTTMPPSPVVIGLDGQRRVIHHGNVALLVWEDQVSAATVLAVCLTAATLLYLFGLWLVSSIHRQRRHARFA